MMRLLVCGSRDWPEDHLWFVDERMIDYADDYNDPVEVIVGDARGVDERAFACARRNTAAFTVREFRADWRKHGRRAGILRNLAMLDTQPDLVLAFHHGGSRGTAHTIHEARKRGIPVVVWTEVPAPDIAALDMGDIE